MPLCGRGRGIHVEACPRRLQNTHAGFTVRTSAGSLLLSSCYFEQSGDSRFSSCSCLDGRTGSTKGRILGRHSGRRQQPCEDGLRVLPAAVQSVPADRKTMEHVKFGFLVSCSSSRPSVRSQRRVYQMAAASALGRGCYLHYTGGF